MIPFSLWIKRSISRALYSISLAKMRNPRLQPWCWCCFNVCTVLWLSEREKSQRGRWDIWFIFFPFIILFSCFYFTLLYYKWLAKKRKKCRENAAIIFEGEMLLVNRRCKQNGQIQTFSAGSAEWETHSHGFVGWWVLIYKNLFIL